MIHTAVSLVRHKAEGKRIAIHVACQDSLSARMDADLMEQAVVNLLDNAIKYSTDQSRIEVETQATQTEICIHVRDQGMGIAPKHLPRLFERFYRVDKARSRKLGGTGLGLAIVKHIIQAHGGRVTVQSTQGRGSTFTLHLPKTSKQNRGSAGGMPAVWLFGWSNSQVVKWLNGERDSVCFMHYNRQTESLSPFDNLTIQRFDHSTNRFGA